MKSSYELAMERLAAQDDKPAKPLTDEQKAAISEIDEKFKAKIAEREIFLQQKLSDAQANGEFRDAEAIQQQLSSEKARLEEEREEAKDRIRNQS